MKIFVTDFGGAIHEVAGAADWPLMEAIKAAGLPIKAECGGCCLCSTCHVYVDADWTARIEAISGDESMTLSDAPDVTEQSRLACQIKLSDALDGLRVTLAPTL